MSREFVISEDKLRGVKTVGRFLPDGRMHVQTLQRIPDSFFDRVKAMRDANAQTARPNTQDHWRHVLEIPDTLASSLFVDGDGKPLALNDPEREKIFKRICNDIDYRDLRVVGGKV